MEKQDIANGWQLRRRRPATSLIRQSLRPEGGAGVGPQGHARYTLLGNLISTKKLIWCISLISRFGLRGGEGRKKMTFSPFLSLFFLLSWVYTFWYFQVNDSIPDELLRYGFSGFLTFVVVIIIIIFIVDFFFKFKINYRGLQCKIWSGIIL